MEKAKLKISGCIHHVKMQQASTDNRLNASGKISKDFRHRLFFTRPERLGGEEHPTRGLRGPDHLHVNVQ